LFLEQLPESIRAVFAIHKQLATPSGDKALEVMKPTITAIQATPESTTMTMAKSDSLTALQKSIH